MHQIVWNAIGKYVGHLTEEEISTAMHEFCSCFHPILKAYQEKLREVKALRNIIKVWKQRNEAWEKESVSQTQEIKELKRTVSMLTKQLASKVCDDCGEKRITEQLSSMSVQENTSESKVMIKSLENRTVCHFHSSW